MKNDIAELRPVVVERLYDNDAVIGKGLVEGETVVIDGQLRVIPGKPVAVKESNATGGGGRGGKAGGDGGKGGKGKKKDKKTET